jgi:hypothetical protein
MGDPISDTVENAISEAQKFAASLIKMFENALQGWDDRPVKIEELDPELRRSKEEEDAQLIQSILK